MFFFAVLLVVPLTVGASLGAQIIDRVLAVVAGAPITLSDVNAVMRLGLVPEAAGKADGVQAALNALIERQLQLIEVNRYAPPEPSGAEIDARIAQIRSRFDSQTAFDRAMKELGVTPAQLRARVRDDLRIESYLRQRFGASYQPDEEEVARYYRSHESDFVRNAVLRPYEEVRDEARKRLVDERMASLVSDWVAGLRRRAEVTVLPK
jgi:SurA-like protein